MSPIKGRLRLLVSTEQEDKVFRALLELAENWDIDVIEVQFSKYLGYQNRLINGLLFLDVQTNNWIINIEKNCSQEKKNFLLAHELGHYALHRHEMKSSDWAAYRGNKKFRSEKELEADRFAEGLLAFLQTVYEQGEKESRKFPCAVI